MSDLTKEQIEAFRDRVQWHPEVVDTVRALCTMALRALDAGWQPMRTAPRDGTRVLVYAERNGRFPAIARNHGNPQSPWWTDSGWSCAPLAWMPLPPPCAEVPHE